MFAPGSVIPVLPGLEQPPPPATAGSLEQGQVSPALLVALMDAMVLWRSQERTVANRPALKGEFGQTSLSPCYAGLRQADTSSRAWKGFCSFSLYFGPQILYIMGSKLTKKISQIPPLLFSTTCSSNVVQTSRVIGNRGTSLRGIVKEGHLNPWTPRVPASHTPILTVYSLLPGELQVSMHLFFCQREEV